MDEALKKSGDWPNVALIPGTHTHAATGEYVPQPASTRIRKDTGCDWTALKDANGVPVEIKEWGYVERI